MIGAGAAAAGVAAPHTSTGANVETAKAATIVIRDMDSPRGSLEDRDSLRSDHRPSQMQMQRGQNGKITESQRRKQCRVRGLSIQPDTNVASRQTALDAVPPLLAASSTTWKYDPCTDDMATQDA